MAVEDDERPLRRYVGWVVALFAVTGVGVGLATNFSMGFLIEQFVDVGGDPMANTLIGIMLINGIVTPLLVGPIVAVVAGVAVGRSLSGRRLTASGVAAVGSLLGFYVMAGLALFLTVVVLQQYGPPGGGGGGGASPFDPAALGRVVLEAGIPATIAGAVAGYVGARL